MTGGATPIDNFLALIPRSQNAALYFPYLLSNDPVSGSPVVAKDGRFGMYVTDGEYNATLRQGDDEDSVSLERAAELLEEKRAKGPAPKKKAAKKKTAKKKTAKKTPATKA